MAAAACNKIAREFFSHEELVQKPASFRAEFAVLTWWLPCPPFWIEAVQPGCPPWTPRGHPRMAKRAPHKNPKIYQTCTRAAFGWRVSILGVHKPAAQR